MKPSLLRLIRVFAVLALVLSAPLSLAQVAGTLDTSFNPGATNGSVYSTAVFAIAALSDGKVMIGGDFTIVGGATHTNIARLNADGSVDESFTASVNGRVSCIIVQVDGKILFSGPFSTVNGLPRLYIARLNADGSLESTTTFNVNLGEGNSIYTMAVQPDGKILICGGFNTVNGFYRNRIARLNPDGSMESISTFNPGNGPSYDIFSVAVQPDGKILLGGYFTKYNGVTRNYVARLHPDGSLENTATFNPGTGANEYVQCMALQADGKIVLAGNFTMMNGEVRNHIARLNPDGSLESTATFNSGSGADQIVDCATLQADGKILLGGDFTTVNGIPRNRIARLNADGSLENTGTFNLGTGANNTGFNASSEVFSAAVQADGKILLGGGFTSINGTTRNHLARLHNDAALQSLTAPDASQVVWSRGGAAPELSQVTFENSVSGETWTALGKGTRIGTTANWRVASISLPLTGKIRARGLTGISNALGSSSLVEQVVTYTAPAAAPAVTTSAASTVAMNSATLNAVASSNGAAANVNFRYSTDPALTLGVQTTAPAQTLASDAIGATVSKAISGLAGHTVYYFQASATNLVGAANGAILSFTTANTAPAAPNSVTSATTGDLKTIPISFPPTDPDGDPVTITSTTAGSHLTINSTTATSVSFTPATDFTGNASFTYSVSDGRGGAATGTITVTISDNDEPQTAITGSPAALTKSTSATLIFGGSDNVGAGSFQGSVDGLVYTTVTSPFVLTGLADGVHSFAVRAVDTSGNLDATPAMATWTVDTTAPQTTIVTSPAALANSRSAIFTFSASESSTYTYSLDNGTLTTGATLASFNGLADGAHTFIVFATDLAGNADTTPATTVWTVDATSPQTTIVSGPASVTNSTTATFLFNASEPSTFTYSIDGSAPTAGVSPLTLSGLTNGAHIFSIRAIDTAGNVDASPATMTWSVDTVPPQTNITTSPAPLTKSTTASVGFSGTDNVSVSSFQGSLDGSPYVATTSPARLNGLTDGVHTFAVRALDTAGNLDATPATATWTVDTTAPETSILSGPPALANSRTAAFTFNADELSTFTVSLDGAPYMAAASPATFNGLIDGAHAFAVRALDAAGNLDATPATTTWIVDGSAPQTNLLSGPASLTNSPTAVFSFSADEAATFSYSLDGGPFTTATSPATFNALADGKHTFAVRALDTAGNVDATPASMTWTMDTTAPETIFLTKPPALTNSTAATFLFSAEDSAAFTYTLDGGLPVTTGAGPLNFAALPIGAHILTVFGTDLAGNADATPATAAWTIDVTAPQTTIGSGPTGIVSSAEATLTFSANEASTFTYRIDGGTPVVGTSPATFSGLAQGAHTFSVFATDLAGNPDEIPATRSWTIRLIPGTAVLFSKGDAVPGAGSEGGAPAGAVFSSFGVPAINDAGAVAFLGKWNSPSGGGQGLFSGNPAVLVVKAGDAALPDATFATFLDPVINSEGKIAFSATLAGSGVTARNNTVLATNAFSPLAVAAREGASTGEADGAQIKSFASFSLQDGELLYVAALQAGSPKVSGSNNRAAFRVTATGTERVVRTGQVHGATTVKNFSLLALSAGSPGQNRAHLAGSTSFLAILADGTHALVDSAAGVLTPFAASGHTTGGTLLPTATFKSFGPVAVPDDSFSAMIATLNPGLDGVTSANATGIFLGNGPAFEPIARLNEPTGLLGAVFGSFQDPVISTGALAFPARIKGAVTATNNLTLWWKPAGSQLTLLAREGMEAADLPSGTSAGVTWDAFPSLALAGGSNGGPLFLATLRRGSGGVNPTNDIGLWAADSVGELRLLVREGQAIGTKTLKSFTALTAVPGSPGVTRSFNNAGQVVYRAAFTDASSALVLVNVP